MDFSVSFFNQKKNKNMENLMFAFFIAGLIGMLYSCEQDNLLPTYSLTMGNNPKRTRRHQ